MNNNDDILAEILEYGDVPPRKPGDIDATQLSEGDPHGRGIRWAYYQMAKIAKERSDVYELLKVYDTVTNHRVKVLRKRI
jgi:hypothetical protein